MFPYHENVRIFSISGVIGIGKSTLMKQLQSDESQSNLQIQIQNQLKTEGVIVTYIFEPSDLWREKGWLASFYANPQKHALSFQMLVFDSHVDAVNVRLKTLRQFYPPKKYLIVCIVERCMYDQLLFWRLQCDLKCAKNIPSQEKDGEKEEKEDMEDEAYTRIWMKWCLLLPTVSKIFYCDSEKLTDSLERINERARPEEIDEKGVTVEYQQALLDKHRKWYTSPMAKIPRKSSVTHQTFDVIPCVHISLSKFPSDETLQQITTQIAQEIVAEIFRPCIK